MTYDQAVRWANDASARLREDTHFVGGRMDFDDVGYSGSTLASFQHFLALLNDVDKPTSDIYLSLLENLRTHSRTQLSRNDWEGAYAAVKAEYEREYGPVPAPRPKTDDKQTRSSSYIYGFSKQEDLDGTTSYEMKDGEILFDTAIKRGQKMAWQMLEAAGLKKGVDFKNEQRGGKWVMTVNPDSLNAVADALERVYPETAAAIRQMAPLWSEHQKKTSPQTLKKWPTYTGAASDRKYETPKHVWDEPNFRVLIYPPRGEWAGDVSAVAPGASHTKYSGNYWVQVPVSGVKAWLDAAVQKYPELAPLLAEVPKWTAQKASLKQDKDAGSAEGGRWQFQSGGEPTLTMQAERYGTLNWRNIPGAEFDRTRGIQIPVAGLTAALPAIRATHPELAKAIGDKVRAFAGEVRTARGNVEGVKWNISVPTGSLRIWPTTMTAKSMASVVPGADYRSDSTGWYVEINEKKVLDAAKVLQQHAPRLAEALTRAFGGAHQVLEGEGDQCEMQRLLSEDPKGGGCVDYSDLPAAARPAVEEVRKQLQSAFPKGLELKPYQVIGVTYAKLSGYRCLIADEPGLGKTMQAIGCLALAADELLPAMIVAPANVTYNWEDEIQKWLPKLRVVVMDSLRDPLPDPGWQGVVICSWDFMRDRRNDIVKRGFQCIIADEAHYAKNRQSSRSKALRMLVVPLKPGSEEEKEGYRPAPHVLLLTGTPMKNTVLEYWPLLSMVAPDAWGKESQFKKQFEIVDRIKKEGSSEDPDQLERLEQQMEEALGGLKGRKACTVIQRLKLRALKDLPPKKRVLVSAPLRGAIAAEYEHAAEAFSDWLERAVAQKLTRMGLDAETASEEAMEAVAKALRAEALVKLNHLRQIAARGKIPATIRMARQLKARNEHFLVFCDHREVVTELSSAFRSAGISFGVISGDTPSKERRNIKQRFQDGKLDAVICTQAAKEGLTLTRAAVTLFVERFWTPADEQQAEDRIHRIGQTRPVTIAFLYAPGTVDEKMTKLVESKRRLINAIQGEGESERGEEDPVAVAAQTDILKELHEAAVLSKRLVALLQRRADPRLRRWIESNQNLHTIINAAMDKAETFSEAEVLDAIRNPRRR